ncbi:MULTISPECIES: hypothetical protein [Spirulina sp. CCY15215]|uniref:hypothetical protein n=1 Tax=Spirulina sp. CCY15215 TaxID=2767591 RepID=UPI00194E1271
MPSSTATDFSAQTGNTNDCEVWCSLKEAIANSSGFQRWMLERQLKNAPGDQNGDQLDRIDSLVRSYLRETLETLAY